MTSSNKRSGRKPKVQANAVECSVINYPSSQQWSRSIPRVGALQCEPFDYDLCKICVWKIDSVSTLPLTDGGKLLLSQGEPPLEI